MSAKYFRGERTVKLVACRLYFRLISNVILGLNGDRVMIALVKRLVDGQMLFVGTVISLIICRL